MKSTLSTSALACVIFYTLCCIMVQISANSSGRQGVSGTGVCNKHSQLNIGGEGAEGHISSPFYPNTTTSNHCDLDIMTCPECRIELTFDVIDFPKCNKPAPASITFQWCVTGCDHFYLHEQYYRLQTSFLVMNSMNGTHKRTYTSVSNRMYLRLCHDPANDNVPSRFSIRYRVIRKSWSYVGTANSIQNIGYFSSPEFPEYYAKHGEIYEYRVQSQDPDGTVLLSFPDWDLSATSRITIYKFNDKVQKYGNSSRPHLLSSQFRVVFEPGNMTWEWPQHMGFMAKFQFLNATSKYSIVNTDCGQYLKQLQGGDFSWNTHNCWPIYYVDCVWVIHKYKDIYESTGTAVAMRIITAILYKTDTLEIRAGVHSRAPLIGVFNNRNMTHREYMSSDGFYIRLRGTCDIWKAFRTVFVTQANASEDGVCNYYMRKCRNNRCIPSSLWCDEQRVDHCGDGSDEERDKCNAPTTSKCSRPYYCYGNSSETYCSEERCDGIPHCSDNSDELNCNSGESNEDDDDDEKEDENEGYHWSYYVPIGMICVLVAFATCFLVVCCMRRKKRLRMAAQRRLARGAQLATVSSHVNPEGSGQGQRSGTRLSINVEIEHYDPPPTYEEAMNFHAVAGAANMGYMPDSVYFSQPPPYSAAPSNNLPLLFGALVRSSQNAQAASNARHQQPDDQNGMAMDNNNTGVQDQNDWNRNMLEDLNGNTNMATANVAAPNPVGLMGLAYGSGGDDNNVAAATTADGGAIVSSNAPSAVRTSTNSEDSTTTLQRLFSGHGHNRDSVGSNVSTTQGDVDLAASKDADVSSAASAAVVDPCESEPTCTSNDKNKISSSSTYPDSAENVGDVCSAEQGAYENKAFETDCISPEVSSADSEPKSPKEDSDARSRDQNQQTFQLLNDPTGTDSTTA